MAIVNDVVTKFSFSGSLTKLSQYNALLKNSIKSISSNTIALAKFGLVATTAITLFTNRTAKAGEELLNLSELSNVSVENIERLGFAATQTGSNSRALESSIASLSKTIGSASLKGNEDFMRLGISVRDASGQIKTADKVLLEVGERFRRFGLSNQQQQDFASKLGIDSNLVNLLGKSSLELRKLFNEADRIGIISNKDAKALTEYNKSLNRLKFGFKSVGNEIALGFAPILRDLSNSFTNFLANNKQTIRDIGQNAGGVLKSVGNFVATLTQGVFKLGSSLGFSKEQTAGFVTGLGLLLSPISKVKLAITALIAVVDDLIVGFKGGESVAFNYFKNIKEILGTNFIDKPKELVDRIRSGESIGSILKDRFSTNRTDETGRFFNSVRLSDQFDSSGNTLKNNLFKNTTSDTLRPNLLDNRFLPNNTTNNKNLSNNNVSQSVVINVTSDNPQEVARVINDSLQDQLNNANAQFNVGGF